MKIYLGEIPNRLRRIAHGLYGAEFKKNIYFGRILDSLLLLAHG